MKRIATSVCTSRLKTLSYLVSAQHLQHPPSATLGVCAFATRSARGLEFESVFQSSVQFQCSWLEKAAEFAMLRTNSSTAQLFSAFFSCPAFHFQGRNAVQQHFMLRCATGNSTQQYCAAAISPPITSSATKTSFLSLLILPKSQFSPCFFFLVELPV